MEDFPRYPVCDYDYPLFGPEGVFVHLLAIHADSPEARWVMEQLGLVLEPSG